MGSASIIIPAWNEAKTLQSTMQALGNVDYNTAQCEVIVVAGGDDRTYEVAEELSRGMDMFARYIVIRQDQGGKNVAIQQGLGEAKNALVVLLDADTIVAKDWLTQMTEPIKKGECDLTIANPYPVRKTWVSDYYMLIKAYVLDKIVTFPGNAVAFKAALVKEKLDYFFDKEKRVGVDYLLEKRFLEEGRRVLFAKDAHVITHLPSSLKYFLRCESRWLSAVISIDGVNYRTLASNCAVVAAIILTVPFSGIGLTLSLLFHAAFVLKKIRMLIVAYRAYDASMTSLIGFIPLSYLYHITSFVAYVKYFLRIPGYRDLSQGQRY